jgi:predicted AAA+ superfamily ATPase
MYEIKEIHKIIELNELVRQKGLKYPKKRPVFFNLIDDDTPTIIGISGLRGIGKTVILSQLLNTIKNSLYISLDSTQINDLFEMAKVLLKQYKINTLLLDEIHYYPYWQRDLKKIYDFLEMKIYFTSSVSLQILKAGFDLSRRVRIIDMPIFSFREFLWFYNHTDYLVKNINITEILEEKENINLRHEAFFEEYLNFPIPAQKQEKSPEIIQNIIAKIIERDLVYAEDINSKDIFHLKNLLIFLANSPVGDIGFSTIAKNLQISHFLAVKYITLLEKAYILNVVYPTGTNTKKEPKILFNLPFRSYLANLPQNTLLGSVKEDFFVDVMRNNKIKIFYLKNNRGRKLPDFMIDVIKTRYIVEIGGKSKGFSQFKGISDKYKKIITTYPYLKKDHSIPLFYFGFLN